MKQQSTGYIFIAPALIFMAFFVGYPIIYNILLSMKNINLLTFNKTNDEFIGLQNYLYLAKDPLLKQALIQTFTFTVFCLIFQFAFGFIFALFFSLDFKTAQPLRGLILVTWMIPMTVTGMLFKFMLSPSDGILNYILQNTGIIKEQIGFLIKEDLAMGSVIFTNTWVGIPFNMILLTTGMSTIPKELYESSSIDGAGAFRNLFSITIPMIKSAMLSVLMLGFIYTFKVFDLIFVMTKGGPLNATEVLSTVSYRYSFEHYDFSKGASVANILFLILICISFFYLNLVRKEENK